MPTQEVLSGPPAGKTLRPPPSISTGGFFWSTTDSKQLGQVGGHTSFRAAPTPAVPSTKVSGPGVTATITPKFEFVPGEGPLMTTDEGNVLALLQKRAFRGNGFNTIFRPRSTSGKPLTVTDPVTKLLKAEEPVPGTDDNVLQLNLTTESMVFGESLGDIPNRGFGKQPDILLKGISYVQRVTDITDPNTSPTSIHFEPGVWLVAQKCDVVPPNLGPTICRMASIPHGTTINAQGNQPVFKSPLPGPQLVGAIGKLNGKLTPTFLAGNKFRQPEGQEQGFNAQTISKSDDNRLPPGLSKITNSPITQTLLDNPNVFLQNSLADQKARGQVVDNFWQIDISTAPTPIPGGGTANIAFLGGTGTSPQPGANTQNANAAKMTATFFVETVRANMPIKGNKSEATTWQPNLPFGPIFNIPPTTGIKDTQVSVTWTQIQYSQNVSLHFNGLNWPHFSVATLPEFTTFDVQLQAAS